ncbi:MAG: 4Fe-4S dicluster domain-containing protein [Anditalea sp.]
MKLIQKSGLILFFSGFFIFSIIPFLGDFKLTDSDLKVNLQEEHYERLREPLTSMAGKTYSSNIVFVRDFNKYFEGYNDKFKSEENWNDVIWDDYAFVVTKAATTGWILDYNLLLFFLSIGVGVLGAMLYIWPAHRQEPAGIKNNGIYFSSLKARGFLGIVLGVYLIGIYIVLYWFPEYITNLALIADPLSYALSGSPASQWFIYGLIYTLAILVMGIRMFRKYKGNKYQTLRTASVMFFQLSFAFIIPEILVLMNMPWHDFKNIWPLDYSFFFDFRLDQMLSSGALGMFMLVWGIILIVLGVPLLSYFYGKRWYCSWICGCGGLAETAGDPYRHLSDKSLKAWKIERYMVHSVLVIIVGVTLVTIANYFAEFDLLGGATGVLHEWYGFIIGAAFAGVIGVGFYPFMGNRVWCRFGCPLAAYIGIVQRFKSRFRITTNGGQCISCGNCSTYCEMGIDVKWYAQRGQNIVRASCVGCGVCSAVCPRGVLKLENREEAGRINEHPIIIGNDSVKIHAQ